MKIKNKAIATLFLLIGLTAHMQAQDDNNATFGLKGGLNLSNITIEDADDNNLKTGFHAGAFVNVPLSDKFSVQPEVLYSAKGAKVTYDEEFLGVSVAEGETTFGLNYIDIPVYLVYNLSEDFNFHLGPYVGFLLNANVDTDAEVLGVIDIDSSEELDRDHFKNMDAGLSAGLGFEFNKLKLGFNYNIGLTQVAEEDDVAETLLSDARNNIIQVYIGIAF